MMLNKLFGSSVLKACIVRSAKLSYSVYERSIGFVFWRRKSPRAGFVFVWLNIFVQVFFPISLSFSARAQAKDGSSYYLQERTSISFSEEPLITGAKDNDEMTPGPLLSPSSVKTRDATSFESALAPGVTSHNAPSREEKVSDNAIPEIFPEQASVKGSPFQEIVDENAIAVIATEAAQLVSGSSRKANALSKAVGIGERMANTAVQDWLNQYGTAQVSFDSKGKGALDVLFSLADYGDSLYFSQLGYRSGNDRDIYNLGLGARYFNDVSMLGVNSFYDFDAKSSSSRLGLGTEIWTDNAKISANIYTPISGWRQSSVPSMQDYDERAARGADIKLSGHLPSLPQLGANISYEKYFGKEVAWTSQSDRQRNPSSIGVGVDYTPFPLLKFGVEHKNSTGNNATSFTAGLTYRLGVSLSEQLNGNAVAASRSLQGSRLQLVERNNNIVYEYRKQELINLHLTSEGNPYSGETIVVTAHVTSKYGIDKVVWDASSLIADGGSVTPVGNDRAKIILPSIEQAIPFRNAYEPRSSYIIGAIAKDKKGNSSERATITLDTQRSPFDVSSISLSKTSAVADGVDSIDITVSGMNGETGQPLAGEPIYLALTNTTQGQVIKEVRGELDVNGSLSVSVSTTLAGQVSAVAEIIRNGNRGSALMTFVGDVNGASFDNSVVELVADNAIANGRDKNKIIVRLYDRNNNLLPNASINVVGSQGVSVAGEVSTDATGMAEIPFSSTRAGSATVQLEINGSTKSIVSNFRADEASAAISKMDVLIDNAIADGESENEVSVSVVDAFGSPVPSVNVIFDVPGNVLISSNGRTDENGILTAKLKSILAGPYIISATVNGRSEQCNLTFMPDVFFANIELQSVPPRDDVVADGTDGHWIEAYLKDPKGNSIANEEIMFSSDGQATLSERKIVTDINGRGRVLVTSQHARVVKVDAVSNLRAKASIELPFAVDLSGVTVFGGSIQLEKDGAVANGIDTNKAFVDFQDRQGDPVRGEVVAFTLVGPNNNQRTFESLTNENGRAELLFGSTTAGIHSLTAKLGVASSTIPTQFVSDATTAGLTKGELSVTANNAKADGKATNAVKALVRDAQGNPVSGVEVSFAVTNGATLVAAKATTGANGEASTTLTNTKAGISAVTATVNGSSKSVDTTFVADTATAGLTKGELSVTANNAKADGKATNAVKALVRDAEGNPVSGVE
ncbi:TPA: Ig-like domain-containing protein, partial [Aeromonas veronii]